MGWSIIMTRVSADYDPAHDIREQTAVVALSEAQLAAVVKLVEAAGWCVERRREGYVVEGWWARGELIGIEAEELFFDATGGWLSKPGADDAFERQWPLIVEICNAADWVAFADNTGQVLFAPWLDDDDGPTEADVERMLIDLIARSNSAGLLGWRPPEPAQIQQWLREGLIHPVAIAVEYQDDVMLGVAYLLLQEDGDWGLRIAVEPLSPSKFNEDLAEELRPILLARLVARCQAEGLSFVTGYWASRLGTSERPSHFREAGLTERPASVAEDGDRFHHWVFRPS